MNGFTAEKILNALKDNRSLKSSELEQIIGVSSFVLKREISELNYFLSSNHIPLEIQSKRGYKNGYTLEGDLKSVSISGIIQAINDEERPVLTVIRRQDTRVLYIMMLLLQKNSGLKLQNLSEEIAISTRTLNKDMVLVRDFLSKFDINVNNRPYHGLYISCSEFDRQSCLHTVYKRLSDYLSAEQTDVLFFGKNCVPVRKRIYHSCIDAFRKTGIILSDLTIIDIATYAWINTVFSRINSEKAELSMETEAKIDRKYIDAAEMILNSPEISAEYRPELSDISSFALRIAGQAAQEGHIAADDFSSRLSKRILLTIDNINGTSFSCDSGFRSRFSEQIQLVFIHQKYRIRYDYPLQGKIRYYYYPGYICACQAAYIFTLETGIQIDETELINMTVTFQHWFSENQQLRRVLLISASGKRNTEILVASIKKMYGGFLEYLDAVPMRRKGEIREDMYDLILTTHWIALNTSLPVVEIEYFMDNSANRKLANALSVNWQLSAYFDSCFNEDDFFTGLDVPSQEEVLKELFTLTGRNDHDPDDYIPDPFIRNRISFSVVMRSRKQKPSILVFVMNKPFKWYEQQTQIVLIETGNVNYRFKEAIIQRMELPETDTDVTHFLNNPTFEAFRNFLLCE